MSSPDEHSRRHGRTVHLLLLSMYTFTSGVHEASLLETEGMGQEEWLDTCPREDIHAIRSTHKSTQAQEREPFLNEANMLTAAPLSHPGSIISQEKKFGHQRKTLI